MFSQFTFKVFLFLSSSSRVRLQDSAASSQYSVPQQSSVNNAPEAPENKARKRSTFILSAADMAPSAGVSISSVPSGLSVLETFTVNQEFNAQAWRRPEGIEQLNGSYGPAEAGRGPVTLQE